MAEAREATLAAEWGVEPIPTEQRPLAASSRLGAMSVATMLLLVSIPTTRAAWFVGKGMAATGRAEASTSSATAPR